MEGLTGQVIEPYVRRFAHRRRNDPCVERSVTAGHVRIEHCAGIDAVFGVDGPARARATSGPDCTCNVAAGTGWVWADPDAATAVDVLFIDEAAQMSLANVLAVSQAAGTVVLLGDPQQLEQPMKGSHPEGTDVSAFHHLLGGHQTIAADRGLFLEETWRLHPLICSFTSAYAASEVLREANRADKSTLPESAPTGFVASIATDGGAGGDAAERTQGVGGVGGAGKTEGQPHASPAELATDTLLTR